MLQFVNSKKKKELTKQLDERFGISKNVFNDYHFIENEEKFWICSLDTTTIDFKNLRTEGIGMLFARKGLALKPTTNMIQLFGNHATKNVVELDEEQKNKFLSGLDISELDANVDSGYVIVKYKNDSLGCSLYKEGTLKNQIPKAKRIKKLY
ncbi:MAG: hypothetical protein KAS12_05785 [Candidatus Aenigmarchaeota archaeon]|nr:hypothetical protein [Candidatus Aenigmarchaeota archaeon]